MLQAIRNNPDNAQFYLEYFKYELKFYEKIKMRIQILNGDNEKKLDFIEDEEEKMDVAEGSDNDKDVENANAEVEAKMLEDGKLSGSARLVEIVFENIVEQFGD